MSICAGSNKIDEKINNIDLLIIPLNMKTNDSAIDNAKALKTVSFLKQIIPSFCSIQIGI